MCAARCDAYACAPHAPTRPACMRAPMRIGVRDDLGVEPTRPACMRAPMRAHAPNPRMSVRDATHLFSAPEGQDCSVLILTTPYAPNMTTNREDLSNFSTRIRSIPLIRCHILRVQGATHFASALQLFKKSARSRLASRALPRPLACAVVGAHTSVRLTRQHAPARPRASRTHTTPHPVPRI